MLVINSYSANRKESPENGIYSRELSIESNFKSLALTLNYSIIINSLSAIVNVTL